MPCPTHFSTNNPQPLAKSLHSGRGCLTVHVYQVNEPRCGRSVRPVALCLAEIGHFTGLFSQIRSHRAVLLVCFRKSDHISAKQREMGLKLLQHIGYMIPHPFRHKEPTTFGKKPAFT